MVNSKNYKKVLALTQESNTTLIVVTKNRSVDDIWILYEYGQRDFGENRVQEMSEKKDKLPDDIRWHMIGHLQTNKVKDITPFIYLIHSVDSLGLLEEINKQAKKIDRVIDCLLQVKIAKEATKFGLTEDETTELLKSNTYKSLRNVKVIGLMGIATNTNNQDIVQDEFNHLAHIFRNLQNEYSYFKELSMGMSADWKIALEKEATMVRIGSLIFS